jgi:isoleucyl-tRNA synthetase
MAPVMPFYAEYLFQKVREESDAESVHLTAWVKGGEVDTKVLESMRDVRHVVTEALEARMKANIKVRQPLGILRVRQSEAPLGDEYLPLIADELNVKQVVLVSELEVSVLLDTTITPELKLEGEMRELVRAIQDTRKELGLQPEDRITLIVDESTKLLVESFSDEVMRTVGATALRVESSPARTLTVSGAIYRFDVVNE